MPLAPMKKAKGRRYRRPLVRRGFLGAAGERKYVDTALAQYECSTTGSITHIDIVPRGDAVTERNGRKFVDEWVNIRGQLVNKNSATYTDNTVLLVWDRQPNKALAAITDILDTNSAYSQNKRENASRFLIVRRWDHTLFGKGDGSTVGPFGTGFDHYVRLPRGLVAECTPADETGAIGNRVSGALLLVTTGSVASGEGASTLSVAIRVGFAEYVF